MLFWPLYCDIISWMIDWSKKSQENTQKKAKKKSACALAGIWTSTPAKCWTWETGALAHYATEACVRIQSILLIYTKPKIDQLSIGLHGLQRPRGENPLIFMKFRSYRYHSAIILSRIKPDIAVARNSRQAKAENSTENRMLHWFLKGIFIFAQWVWGPQLVHYKWLWSKLPNYSMIFWPKMHDFRPYMTTVQYLNSTCFEFFAAESLWFGLKKRRKKRCIHLTT